MLSECCIEYINLYNFTEEFRVVFRFSHTSTFEQIPQSPRLSRSLGNSGGEYGSFSLPDKPTGASSLKTPPNSGGETALSLPNMAH